MAAAAPSLAIDEHDRLTGNYGEVIYELDPWNFVKYNIFVYLLHRLVHFRLEKSLFALIRRRSWIIDGLTCEHCWIKGYSASRVKLEMWVLLVPFPYTCFVFIVFVSLCKVEECLLLEFSYVCNWLLVMLLCRSLGSSCLMKLFGNPHAKTDCWSKWRQCCCV